MTSRASSDDEGQPIRSGNKLYPITAPIRGLFIAGVCKLLEVGRGLGRIFAFCLDREGMRTRKTDANNLCC